MKNLTTLITMALLLSLILVGCSKINQENYDKIKIGMDYQEVIEIIGNPERCDAVLGAKNCIWGNEKKNITIKFVANKVALPAMKGL